LEPIDTTVWYPRLAKKDFTIGLSLIGNGLDEPDQTLYENYTCNAEGNYDGLQSRIGQDGRAAVDGSDKEKRRQMVWEIEKKLAEDVARPMLYHSVSGTCWHPYVRATR
jgi:peptide/nickel transport system substrate-binding protein